MQTKLFPIPQKLCDICHQPVFIKKDSEIVFDGFRDAATKLFVGFKCCRDKYYENKEKYVELTNQNQKN